MSASGGRWHRDPTRPGSIRYHDGQQWTEHTSPKHPVNTGTRSRKLLRNGIVSAAAALLLTASALVLLLR